MPSIVLVCVCSTVERETKARLCSVSLWRRGEKLEDGLARLLGKVLVLLEMGRRTAQGERARLSHSMTT